MNEVAALISAVFIASLLGSLHCAGMCSPFLMFAVAADDSAPHHGLSVHAAYHLGRLATYITLGIIAGAIGHALDLGGATFGIGRFAAIFAGTLMILFGLGSVLRFFGTTLPRIRAPKAVQNLVKRGHRAAFELEPTQRALVVGLLTTLLPCGWLYAFAVAAAGTGSPIMGGLTMAVFWTGTLPVMISLGVGLRELTGPIRRAIPLVSSLVIVAIGFATVLGRAKLPAFSTSTPMSAQPVGLDESTQKVKSINDELPPCCVEPDEPESADPGTP